MKSYRSSKKAANRVVYAALTVLSIAWLLPIAWLIMTSFRGEGGAFTLYLIPKQWTFGNYMRLFTDTKLFSYPRWFTNTLVVSVCCAVFSSLFVLMISYILSRLRFPSRRGLLNLGLILGMFPGFMAIIAVYFIIKALGLSESLLALILVYSGGAGLGYFVCKGFFDTIPRAMEEAAIIDGATLYSVFWRVVLPLSRPIVIYTIIAAFMAPWGEFIVARYIMRDNYQNYTVALGLWQMLQREFRQTYFTRFCAGSVLIAIPITAVFIKLQQFYIEGVTGGSVKG